MTRRLSLFVTVTGVETHRIAALQDISVSRVAKRVGSRNTGMDLTIEDAQNSREQVIAETTATGAS